MITFKQVYIQKSRIDIYLKNGIKIEACRPYYTRNCYNYGIIPNDEQITYGYDEFIKVYGLSTDRTLFKKRIYINYSWIGERIYKDSFDKAIITLEYEIVDEPIIDWLQKDLKFNKYSELVFNRENELRKLSER